MTPLLADCVNAAPSLARRRLLQAAAAAIALPGCSPSVQAPSFSYTLLDGTRGHSQDLLGKVVLVNFWATSCAVCVQEMPALAATYRGFQARGFETLAVSMRLDPPAAVAQFAESRRLPFGVVIDNTGAIAKAWGDVSVTPTTFLVDKRGRIAERLVGAPDFQVLNERIEQLLSLA